MMRCSRGGVSEGGRAPVADGAPGAGADEIGVARRDRPRPATPSTCGSAVVMRNCRSRGDIPERSSADTRPCLTSESPAAAGTVAASASTRVDSSGESEMSDRNVRPTHLMSPYAIPISANASAPYLRLAATRKGKGSRDAQTDRRGISPSGDRQANVRSIDASRRARVMLHGREGLPRPSASVIWVPSGDPARPRAPHRRRTS